VYPHCQHGNGQGRPCFGSEVKDSHDRYANIEVNYLLQRMEAYPGVAILATNMKSALDNAFMRRLRFVVSFPYPSAIERETIWRKAFPRATPAGPLDWERLAVLPATGAMIHNIALGAAFRASERGGEVTTDVVLEVARTEFRKLELPTVERQFQVDAGVGAPA
jgi:SpoVK/Ycf46/Vps4 family AAA+-type ATPase